MCNKPKRLNKSSLCSDAICYENSWVYARGNEQVPQVTCGAASLLRHGIRRSLICSKREGFPEKSPALLADHMSSGGHCLVTLFSPEQGTRQGSAAFSCSVALPYCKSDSWFHPFQRLTQWSGFPGQILAEASLSWSRGFRHVQVSVQEVMVQQGMEKVCTGNWEGSEAKSLLLLSINIS